MMISPLAIEAVRPIVDASDFYRDSHAKIYRAALALHDHGEPVDAITLTNELEQRGELEGVGGRVRLHELSLIVPASANAGHYAEIVRETATLRGLIRAGGEIAQLGWNREGDPAQLVELAQRLVGEVLERRNRAGQLDAQPWADFERDATEHIQLLVDELWPEGALGFLGAAPKKGKTWIGLDLAIAVATGTPFLGRFDVPTARPVVYAALEGHKAAIRGRIGCLTRGHGRNPSMGSADLENLHVLYKPAGLNLTDPSWLARLHELTDRLGAKLLVVDVLRAAAVLKENSNDEFRDLVRTLQPITTGGCSLALLHHFGKLSEISRERTPGERMAGAGAMYGAFDVGVFITGSEGHARQLRVEFEARDLPAPDPIGVQLAGEPTGPNGGFVFTDTARWIEREAPEPDDIKAPAEEIAEYVREQGGDVERRHIELHFDISDKTLGKRFARLHDLGIDLVRANGRGRPARLVAQPEPFDDDQLDIDFASAPSLLTETDKADKKPCKSPETSDHSESANSDNFEETPANQGFYHSESSLGVDHSDSERSGTPSVAPLNQAKNGDHSDHSESGPTDHSERSESADLQDIYHSDHSDSLLRREQPLDGAPTTQRPTTDNADDLDWSTP